MTHQQTIAIDNHCRFAFEVMHRQFLFLDSSGKASVVLTVNSGYACMSNFGGVPIWHISVAARPGHTLGNDERERIASDHFTGVGDSDHEWRSATQTAFHLLRRLTEEERLRVGPAVDCRGTPEWDRRLEAMKGCANFSLVVQVARRELQGVNKTNGH